MLCRRGEPHSISCTTHGSCSVRGRCLLAGLLLCLLRQTNSADSDCVLASWSQWTGWTPECNNASTFQQHRQRSCVLPPLDSRPCATDLCGVQNRTVTASRTVPPTTCCQDLAWGEWSQWSPACSDLLCNATTLHNTTSKGPCIWMGEEEGLVSNISIVQIRRRMRDDCTAERCPECEGEEQARVASLQVWGPWSQWSCHNSRMIRRRVCEQTAEKADVYCQLCAVGIVEEEHDVQCPGPSISPNVTVTPMGRGGGGGGLGAAVLGVMVGMLVVAVVCVLLGALFFCLCWREFKRRQSYTLRTQPPTDTQSTSHLVFTGPKEQWTGGSGETSLPLVPMQQMSGGIPPHPSAQQPRTPIHRMEAEDVSLHSSREDLLGEPMHDGHSVSHKLSLSPFTSGAKRRLTDISEISSSHEDLLERANTTSDSIYANDPCSDSDNSMSWL